MTASACVKSFFDGQTCTVTYVVSDPQTAVCVIIDPVLDYDPAAARTATVGADKVIAHVRKENLKVEWIIETHAHADHLTASVYLKENLGGKTGIGADITKVQKTFSRIYNFEKDFMPDGRQFDCLFEDGQHFSAGNLKFRVMHTPGHTPACVTYVLNEECAFVGDTIFMPDFGTARCDFPEGSAEALYDSIQKIFSLPPQTKLYLCHDYAPDGREYQWETTVAQQARENIHIKAGTARDRFVKMRQARDKTLEMPTLLLPSVQVNIRAGQLPPAEDDGVSYLKLPLNRV